MVRTRGLGRALGQAIGKVLGRREANDDDNDVPSDEGLPHLPVGSDNSRVCYLCLGFPGGPHDTSVLRDFENLIALRVWNGEERPELKLYLPMEGRWLSSGGLLQRLRALWLPANKSFDHMFPRYGRSRTNFPIPVREVTITFDEVASLLHFPIVGVFHSFEQLHVDDVVDMLVELLEVSFVEARAETIQCHGSYVRLSCLRDVYQTKIEACH
ncbi:hypothetical protein GmHk_06G016667 [Glycine max]|nr:hypothetical protein GmHk_06G016667 [Glycine max]